MAAPRCRPEICRRATITGSWLGNGPRETLRGGVASITRAQFGARRRENDRRADLPTSTDILIVGAGPTGLALANALRRLGLDRLLIDRQAEGANTSRAAVVHARKMEVLEPLGLTAKLLTRGIEVLLFSMRDGARTLAEVSFGDCAGYGRDAGGGGVGTRPFRLLIGHA